MPHSRSPRRSQARRSPSPLLPWQLTLAATLVLTLLTYLLLPAQVATWRGAPGTWLYAWSGWTWLSSLASFAVLLLGLVGSVRSWWWHQRRQRLLRRATSLAALRDLSWQEFELLIGQLYRRKGYQVTETGQGGADGGIDLVARKWGTSPVTILVQCKHYQRQAVGVPIVRELFGLLTHHQATEAAVVCCGHFTLAAREFAEGKPIQLIGADVLLATLKAQRTSVAYR